MILVRGLARRGIDAAIAGQTLLVALVSFYSAYLIAALAALAVLWLDHQTKPALVVAGAVLGALAVGTFAAVAFLRRRGVPPEWLTRVRTSRICSRRSRPRRRRCFATNG